MWTMSGLNSKLFRPKVFMFKQFGKGHELFSGAVKMQKLLPFIFNCLSNFMSRFTTLASFQWFFQWPTYPNLKAAEMVRRHFVYLIFCLLDILSTWRFANLYLVNLPFCHLVILPTCHCVNMPYCKYAKLQYAILSTWHFFSAILSTCHLAIFPFFQLPLCQYVMLPTCHFVNKQFCLLAILSACHFESLSFCQLSILSACHFVSLPFCHLAYLSTCHFVNLQLYQCVILAPCHFVNMPFCQVLRRWPDSLTHYLKQEHQLKGKSVQLTSSIK